MWPKFESIMGFFAYQRIAIAILREEELLTAEEGTRLAQEVNRRQSAAANSGRTRIGHSGASWGQTGCNHKEGSLIRVRH